MNYFIKLDKAKMNLSDQEMAAWETRYVGIIVPTPTIKNWITIDVELLYNSIGNDNWLDDNGKFIDFENSKQTIELLHLIDSKNTIKQINSLINAGVQELKTLKELKDDLLFNFDDDQYRIDNYQILSFKNQTDLNPVTFGSYDKSRFCFSSPFLKSIIDVNRKDIDANNMDINKITFHFVLFKNEIGKDALGIKVDLLPNSKYYDFSQNPPFTARTNSNPRLLHQIIINPISNNPFHVNDSKINIFINK